MSDWLKGSVLDGFFDAETAAALTALTPRHIPAGTVLFRPGDRPEGFLLILAGKVNVFLNSRTGRELLLYSIEPGQTCLQTTLAVLGSQTYSGEALAESDLVGVAIPWPAFNRLMGASDTFRNFVFKAFADRVGEMTHLLEMVAFMKVEFRLARWLLDNQRDDATIEATQSEIAAAIGSAREVVSRRLETMSERGIVDVERKRIRVLAPERLRALVANGEP